MNRFAPMREIRLGACVLAAGLLSGLSAIAGSDKKTITPEEDPVFSNWINFSLGGLITSGNQAQFQQQHPVSGPVFGGIDDSHLEKTFGKAQFTLDARAIFANSDYKIQAQVMLPDVGYIKAGFTEFCTYANGNGGFLPPSPTLPNGSLGEGPEYSMYRGLAFIEAGLRVPSLPEVTFRYEHAFRSGKEDSTEWGGTTNTGLNYTTQARSGAGSVASPYTWGQRLPDYSSDTRKTLASFRNISEKRDTFLLDGKYLIGKPDAMGNTELKAGGRMDFITNSDSLNWQNLPGVNPTPLDTKNPITTYNAKNWYNFTNAPNHYYITDTQDQTSNIYNGHISSVTRFGDKLMFTLGYSYTNVSSHVESDRIAGPAYGVPYSPYYNNVVYNNLSSAYQDLGGASNMQQSVAVANLLWTPIEGLSITPSIRIENDDTTSMTNFLTLTGQTLSGTTPTNLPIKPGSTTKSTLWRTTVWAGQAAQRSNYTSSVKLNNIAESLELRYTGIENWVFYASGEWTEGNEARTTNKPSGGLLTATDLNLNSNITNLNQKYSIGANWYPLAQLNFAVQYYTLLQSINQNIRSDDNPRMTEGVVGAPPVYVGGVKTVSAVTGTAGVYSSSTNQRLQNQAWVTNDLNFRVTWRPISNLTLVSRYDFTSTDINSQWSTTGAPASMILYSPGQSGLMLNSAFSESLTWNPIDRLYFQGSVAFVFNSTTSPAAALTPAIQQSINNYITASLGAGYAIDNKTNLRVDASFYNANDYSNSMPYGVPYNAGATEYDYTVSLNRQISRNVSVSLKYYYNTYRDVLSGGNNSYTAQIISSSMQVQF